MRIGPTGAEGLRISRDVGDVDSLGRRDERAALPDATGVEGQPSLPFERF